MIYYKTFPKSFASNKVDANTSRYTKNKDCAERQNRRAFGVSLVGVCADLEQYCAVIDHYQGMSILGLFVGPQTLCP